jgi:hypothetical protein
MVRVIGKAATDYLSTLRRDGTTRHMLERMFDFRGINDVIGTEALLSAGDQYKDQASP